MTALTDDVADGDPTGIAGRIAFGLAGGLYVGLVAGLFAGPVLGLMFGLLIGLGPALQLAATQVTWWLRGRRVRFLPLLQTALHRQVLRQAGAVYQFRHAALQDFLKARAPTQLPNGVIDIQDPDSPT